MKKLITDLTKRWIEIGKVLSVRPEEKIICPVCDEGILAVIDIENKYDEGVIERQFSCYLCGAGNALRIRL